MELPWSNAAPIQRDCLCSNRSLPINIKSLSHVVEVHFTIQSMTALDDYNNLFFEGVWDFVRAVPCLQKRRVRGPSGEIKYELPLTNEDQVGELFFFSSRISVKDFNFDFNFILRKIANTIPG